MEQPIVLTGDTAVTSVTSTHANSYGFSLSTLPTDSFGGGALNVYYRNKSRIDNPWQLVDSPAPGDGNTYGVGANMEIGLEVTGSTNPSITVTIGIIQ